MAIDGMDSWIKKLEKMKENFPKQTDTFLKQKAEEVIGETKKLTPVDNGILKSGWQRENNRKFKQVVFNLASYSAHVEWGHRQEVGRYVPKLKKRLKTPSVKGHYMLHKGINRVRAKFYKDLEIVYKNLIK